MPDSTITTSAPAALPAQEAPRPVVSAPEDTLQAPVKKSIFVPWSVSRIDQAPLAAAEAKLYTSAPPSYLTGLRPEARAQRMSNNSGILTLIAMMFILLAFNFRYCIQLFKVLGQELFSVRRRANAFDEPTANETRVILVLLLVLWVCEGLMLYAGLVSRGIIGEGGDLFTPIAAMIGVAFGFYLFQLVAYSVVGYAFTDKIGSTHWLKGFNSSQAFLGILLLVPTMVAIFYPTATMAMLVMCVIFYVMARIVFIFKGFRIFYHNFQSLLYFILYLCALEIVPVILVISISIILAQQLQ